MKYLILSTFLSTILGVGLFVQEYSKGNLTPSMLNGILILTPETTGVHWTDKLATAYGSPACVGGCTIDIPDSVADDGSATTPVIPDNVNLRFTGSATFGDCVITMGKFSGAENIGHSHLQHHGSNCTGPTYLTQATLQTSDSPRLVNIKIDCNSQPNSIGILFAAASTKLVTREVEADNCTNSGMELLGAQFTRHYADSFWNDTVQIKMYTVLGGGGGNSNEFHGIIGTNGTVGVVLNDNGGSALGMTANLFDDCNFINNSVAQYASKQLYAVSSFTVQSGTTETTGSTPSTTIDGFTISNAAIYIFGPGSANIENFYNADSTRTPWAVLRNGARLNITNSGGYGNGSGVWANTDATSTVAFYDQFINVPNAVLMSGTGTLINRIF